MKKPTFLIVFLLLESASVFPQVAINVGSFAPHSSAMLDVSSVTRGFLLPRMTMSELEAIIEPATGLLVYCASDNNFFVNRGTELSPDWTMVNSKWRANGPNIYYLNGNVGIRTQVPAANLHVAETPFTYTGIFGTPISTWNFGTNVSIGDDDNSPVLYIGQSTTHKGYLIWHRDVTPSLAYLSLGTYGDENSLVLQVAGGKIGISTTNPIALLDIHTDEQSYTTFGDDNMYCQYIFHLEDPLDGYRTGGIICCKVFQQRERRFGI